MRWRMVLDSEVSYASLRRSPCVGLVQSDDSHRRPVCCSTARGLSPDRNKKSRFYEAGTPKSMSLPRYDFEDGDFWGTQIFNDLEAHASAWIYWNMILDEKGGPWSVSYVHGNPDPNIQHPVVIIDREKKKVTYTGLYYYLTHFSKFVRPGAVRVQTLGSQEGMRVMAFKRPDGGMVIELMNSRKEDADVNLSWHGQLLRLKLPAVSITTALWNR